jgi:hypothetical protein
VKLSKLILALAYSAKARTVDPTIVLGEWDREICQHETQCAEEWDERERGGRKIRETPCHDGHGKEDCFVTG